VDALYAKLKKQSPQTTTAVSKEQLRWALLVCQVSFLGDAESSLGE
jgi:hypothetical protein